MSTEIITTARLAELESIIRRGMRTFIEVGNALLEIRNERLYREQGYKTFEVYCQKRWGWTRQRGYQLIAAAKVAGNLTTLVDKPPNERRARELTRLSPEQQREVAQEVNFAQVTASDLKVIVAGKKEKAEVVQGSERCPYRCAESFQRLGVELHNRREQLDTARRGRKWDLDKLNKLELLNLFDWFERELLTYGESVLR